MGKHVKSAVEHLAKATEGTHPTLLEPDTVADAMKIWSGKNPPPPRPEKFLYQESDDTTFFIDFLWEIAGCSPITFGATSGEVLTSNDLTSQSATSGTTKPVSEVK